MNGEEKISKRNAEAAKITQRCREYKIGMRGKSEAERVLFFDIRVPWLDPKGKPCSWDGQ